MKDLHNNIDVVTVLHSVAVSATQTITDIDFSGANSIELVFDIGVDAGTGLGASHNFTFTLQHSDDGTTYTNVAAADVLGVTPSSGVILTIDSADEDNTLYHYGYVGGKKYGQIIITETGTVSCPVSITMIKGHLLDAPPIS